jgi:hypothetical protein
VWEEDPEDIANQYILKSWHRFDGAVPYEALFVLYYDAVDRVKAIEKHMPDLLDEYLDFNKDPSPHSPSSHAQMV